MSVTTIVLIIIGGGVVLLAGSAYITRVLVHRGLRTPWVVKQLTKFSDAIVDSVKQPITVAVLDEVADVLSTGNYTRNIASALEENHEEIKSMIAEKLAEDPTARHIGLLPFHEALVAETTETALRVILAVLADARTEELISDLLRDNVSQIRAAVRARGMPVGEWDGV